MSRSHLGPAARTAMRGAVFVFTLVGMHVAASAAPVTRPGSGEPACEVAPSPGDRREVTCSLPAGSGTQHHRYQVTFTGGHDDTRASIELAIDGKATDCERGSKTSLFGEDGEVGLYCDFSTAPAASKHVVTLTIVWSHAEYKDFALLAR